ncbi:hypothetical protein [Accumulibacter sp.]|uniref:hypothetical protein n=1 Tax=Accumulibacter sp. TaxID=2053492 RepID=UPI0028C43868|nr:hypothetical protein [Accumulibacter sp.]
MTIETAFTEIEQSRLAWHGLYDLLVNGQYDVAGPRASIAGQSVQSFAKRVDLVFEGLLALRPSDNNSAQASAVAGKASEIGESAKTFNTHATALANTLRPNSHEGVTFKDANGNFSVQVTQSDGTAITNIDLAGNFEPMNAALGQLTTQLALLIPIFRADAVGDLSQRARALGDVLREVDTIRDQVKRIAETAAGSSTTISAKESEIQTSVTQAETHLVQIAAHQQQATTDASSVATLVEKIKTIGSAADTLEKLVAGHTSSVEAFQKQLDGRNAEFEKFQETTKIASEENAEREEEISRLIDVSNAMISGATTAGLAKSMEDTRARYEARMTSARKGFYVAVVLLVISAVPLIFHLLPGLFGTWAAANTQDEDGTLYSFIGRLFLLLPATWLTAFFAKSYASFFDLEREYAHKAALAMSVDGFKRQAPKYEEEITAEVFMEIRKNPGTGDATTPASHPLYDVLAKVVEKVVDRKPDAAKKP